MRVRLTSDPKGSTVLEPTDATRCSKHVRDLPAAFVARYIQLQQDWWLAQAELADHLRATGEAS